MHQAYVVPGVVDGAIVNKQAEARARDARHPEATSVHMHAYGKRCNSRCYLVKPQLEENKDVDEA